MENGKHSNRNFGYTNRARQNERTNDSDERTDDSDERTDDSDERTDDSGKRTDDSGKRTGGSDERTDDPGKRTDDSYERRDDCEGRRDDCGVRWRDGSFWPMEIVWQKKASPVLTTWKAAIAGLITINSAMIDRYILDSLPYIYARQPKKERGHLHLRQVQV